MFHKPNSDDDDDDSRKIVIISEENLVKETILTRHNNQNSSLAPFRNSHGRLAPADSIMKGHKRTTNSYYNSRLLRQLELTYSQAIYYVFCNCDLH